MKNKIPKHIVDIYLHALKKKLPLTKMIDNGVLNQYNYGKGRAASFVGHYIITEKKK